MCFAVTVTVFCFASVLLFSVLLFFRLYCSVLCFTVLLFLSYGFTVLLFRGFAALLLTGTAAVAVAVTGTSTVIIPVTVTVAVTVIVTVSLEALTNRIVRAPPLRGLGALHRSGSWVYKPPPDEASSRRDLLEAKETAMEGDFGRIVTVL